MQLMIQIPKEIKYDYIKRIFFLPKVFKVIKNDKHFTFYGEYILQVSFYHKNQEVFSFLLKNASFVQKVVFFSEKEDKIVLLSVSLENAIKYFEGRGLDESNEEYQFYNKEIRAKSDDGSYFINDNDIMIGVLKDDNLGVIEGFLAFLNLNIVIKLDKKEIKELKLDNFEYVMDNLSKIKEEVKKRYTKEF